MLKFLIMYMSVIVAVLEQQLPQLSEGSRQVLQLVVEVDVLLDQSVDGVLQLKRSTTHAQQHTNTHTAQSARAIHPQHTLTHLLDSQHLHSNTLAVDLLLAEGRAALTHSSDNAVKRTEREREKREMFSTLS